MAASNAWTTWLCDARRLDNRMPAGAWGCRWLFSLKPPIVFYTVLGWRVRAYSASRRCEALQEDKPWQ
jgi:hypothetical protein